MTVFDVSNDDVKECPFCGEKPVVRVIVVDKPGNFEFMIYCDNEGCPIMPILTPRKDKSHALELWNKRNG